MIVFGVICMNFDGNTKDISITLTKMGGFGFCAHKSYIFRLHNPTLHHPFLYSSGETHESRMEFVFC